MNLKGKNDTAPMASSMVMFEGSTVSHSLCTQFLFYDSSHVVKFGSIVQVDIIGHAYCNNCSDSSNDNASKYLDVITDSRS